MVLSVQLLLFAIISLMHVLELGLDILQMLRHALDPLIISFDVEICLLKVELKFPDKLIEFSVCLAGEGWQV